MTAKKICFITTNHICTNPRLVKEASAAADSGHNIYVIFTQYSKLYAAEDHKILNNNPSWKYAFIDWSDGGRGFRSIRKISGMRQKVAKILLRFSTGVGLYKIILNRHYSAQLKLAVSVNADLYIAHNAGALAVAGDAAQSINKEFAFDAEDFHRGEALKELPLKAVVVIENEYLKKAKYVSASSPLITEEYKKLFNDIDVFTIRNVFPLNNIPIREIGPQEPIMLFWFSQTVGTDRGVQDIINSMRLVDTNHFELHIYGFVPRHSEIIFNELINSLRFELPPKVIFHGVIPPDELLKKAAGYDIGFATEPGFCLNNEIALSNKIFTYLAGGNAVIFSNTKAQRGFFEQYNNIGHIYNSGDFKSVADILMKYCVDRKLLKCHKENSKRLFEENLNWEFEKSSFLSKISLAVAN